jgi:AraC-like DNA-binding protein
VEIFFPVDDENSTDQAARDLLGDPLDQNRETWGRPGFEKTPQNQEVVQVLKAAGWSNERIARHLGIDPKTLRKHFSRELSLAADASEAEALLTIFRRMKDGNVSAARQVMTLAEKGRAAPPEPKQQGAETAAPDAEAAADKLGKKERLNEAAKTPSGDWGDLLH